MRNYIIIAAVCPLWARCEQNLSDCTRLAGVTTIDCKLTNNEFTDC
jgi:hypothetical protein